MAPLALFPGRLIWRRLGCAQTVRWDSVSSSPEDENDRKRLKTHPSSSPAMAG